MTGWYKDMPQSSLFFSCLLLQTLCLFSQVHLSVVVLLFSVSSLRPHVFSPTLSSTISCLIFRPPLILHSAFHTLLFFICCFNALFTTVTNSCVSSLFLVASTTTERCSLTSREQPCPLGDTWQYKAIGQKSLCWNCRIIIMDVGWVRSRETRAEPRRWKELDKDSQLYIITAWILEALRMLFKYATE